MKSKKILIGLQLLIISCMCWTCKSNEQNEDGKGILDEIKISNIKFDIADYNMNGVFEVGEELKFKPRNLSQGASTFFWEFGNGDASTERYPMYIFEEGGKYLVTFTVDNNEKVEKVIEIKKMIQSSPLDSIVVIDANRNVFVDEEIVFKAHVAGAKEWSWEFGEVKGLVTSSRVGQIIHSYKEPRTYIVKATTDLSMYPDTHKIVVHPRFEEIKDKEPVDSLQLVADDIKMRLQKIADSSVNDFETIIKERNEIQKKYLCGDISEVSIIINGSKYNDFYTYCQGIHHLDSPEKESVLINEVKIDTIKCISRIEISQSEALP